jgi:hypothetical protein
MGMAAFWERWRTAGAAENKEQETPAAAWTTQLKKGLAAIALAKISQQFGREEEKEK